MKVGIIDNHTLNCLKKEKDSPLNTLYGQFTKFIIKDILSVENKIINKIYHSL